jgi:hypothetical protein
MALLSPSRANGDIAPTDPLHDPNAGAARTKAPPGTVKPAILNLVEQSSGVKIPETFKAASAELWPCAPTTPELLLGCLGLHQPGESLGRRVPLDGLLHDPRSMAGSMASNSTLRLPPPQVLPRVSLALVGRDGSDPGSHSCSRTSAGCATLALRHGRRMTEIRLIATSALATSQRRFLVLADGAEAKLSASKSGNHRCLSGLDDGGAEGIRTSDLRSAGHPRA